MKKQIHVVSLLVLLSLFIASCSPSASAKVTPNPVTDPTQTTVVVTSTPAPSPTPQQSKVLLVAPAGMDAQPAQALLTELSSPGGLTVEVRPDLQKTDLGPEVKVVVFLSAPGNLNELVAATPQTQFITVASTDLQAAGNLTVMRQRPENQAFIAGYLSVLLSTDYRAAGLLPEDGPLGAGLKEAFANGAAYFCGVCAPGWPLNLKYPAFVTLPAASDGPTWQNAVAGVYDTDKPEVFYLSPEAASHPEVINFLQGKTQFDNPVRVVGAQIPPEALREQWAASVDFEILSGIRQVWPDVSAGKGGTIVDAQLVVENVNPALLGGGKMRLVKDLIEQVKSGDIYPFSVPIQ